MTWWRSACSCMGLVLALGLAPASQAKGPTRSGAGEPTQTTPAPLLAGAGEPTQTTRARLLAWPATPTAHQPVLLVAQGLPAGASDFAWDSSGGGAYTLRTAAPLIRISSGDPGTRVVALQYAVAARTYIVRLALRVSPRAAGLRVLTARRDPRRRAGRRRLPIRVHLAARRTRPATARAARDAGASIVDFAFAPRTITVHVGVTVTWTNTGKQPHSATADNHSFDTGVLRTGQSGSHTFATAGTFTYFCIVHPFMHGTIVVLAAAHSSPPTAKALPPPSASGSSATPASSAGASASGPTLPFTGLDVFGAAILAAMLLGAGIALRIAVR